MLFFKIGIIDILMFVLIYFCRFFYRFCVYFIFLSKIVCKLYFDEDVMCVMNVYNLFFMFIINNKGILN